jgi:hypothetical protein
MVQVKFSYMKLTIREQQELDHLRESKKSRTIPMTQLQHERLTYLNRKEVRHCCSNAHCTGYEGKENENICPKCGSKLFKLI